MRTFLCAVWLGLNGALMAAPVTIDFPQDGSRVELITTAAGEPRLTITPVATGTPLLGRMEVLADRLVFVPALPLVPGQRYRAEWLGRTGKAETAEFEIHVLKQSPPDVQMLPRSPLPANALKVYLQFSQPMEQGVFLDRLCLLDAAGKEVTGPFRETELWSPDGRRLTVWLHPGRQKTGVNLNISEGPVLRPGSRYSLMVSGLWRSSTGTPLGKDQAFHFDTIDADHTCPAMARWKIQAPAAGTLEPLQIEFDEPLDPAMLGSALQVWHQGRALKLRVSSSGRRWSAVPEKAWTSGRHELRADPLLEDLAGNNLKQPFEVDVQAAPVAEALLNRDFIIK